MGTERVPSRSGAEVRQAAAAFARPISEQGALQLLTSFGPFIAACVAMYLVFPISYPLTLALAVPTGALLVRIFIIQHDCGHGSFFASHRANALVGRLCSLITLTPFAKGDWSFADAALQGSSWFGLPPFLHWLTGNIGFHHIPSPQSARAELSPPRGTRGGARPAACEAPQHFRRLARTVADAVGRGCRPTGALPRRGENSSMTAPPR
jgi:hypothetical protein